LFITVIFHVRLLYYSLKVKKVTLILQKNEKKISSNTTKSTQITKKQILTPNIWFLLILVPNGSFKLEKIKNLEFERQAVTGFN
jgi:hypothetical protein